VIGALMSLLRVKTGQGGGQVVDVSLVESVFNLMESLVPEYDLFGHVRPRSGGALPGVAPSNTYRTADGSYVVIAGNSDPIFKRLMRVIGRNELADDPALAHNDGRAAQAAMLDGMIGEWTARYDIDIVLKILAEADVPAGRIYSAADIVADPHYRARQMLLRSELPDGTSVRMPGIVPKLSETPGVVRWIGPKLGEHTAEVLAELGFSDDQVDWMSTAGMLPALLRHDVPGQVAKAGRACDLHPVPESARIA
jgi:crotonobetainyl-CoA:carnitine CoA-transferase CaiB-like acyl-CoA transferase